VTCGHFWFDLLSFDVVYFDVMVFDIMFCWRFLVWHYFLLTFFFDISEGNLWDWPDPNGHSKRRRAHLLPPFILCPVSKGATNSRSMHLLFPCVSVCTIPQDPHIFTFPYWTKVQTPVKVALYVTHVLGYRCQQSFMGLQLNGLA